MKAREAYPGGLAWRPHTPFATLVLTVSTRAFQARSVGSNPTCRSMTNENNLTSEQELRIVALDYALRSMYGNPGEAKEVTTLAEEYFQFLNSST